MLQMAVYHFFELVMVLHEEDDLKAVTEKLKEDVVHDLWDAAQAIECLERLEIGSFPAQGIASGAQQSIQCFLRRSRIR